MGFKANTALSMLMLRILCLAVLVGSAVLLLTNNYKTSDGDKTSFKNIHTYRYEIATAAVGAAYLIIQVPLGAYYAAAEKRMISGRFLPEFDFYGDKVVALLLASGVGAGFAASFELKKFLRETLDALIVFALRSGDERFFELVPALEEARSKAPGFFVRGYIASSVLLVACALMFVLSVLSSINRTK